MPWKAFSYGEVFEGCWEAIAMEIVKKIFTILFGWIVPLGMGIYFIVVHIIGCKIVTFEKKVSVKESEHTSSDYSFTIVKGRLSIGTIYFTDKYVSMRTYNCTLSKMMVERDRVAIGYIEGKLVIIISEQGRELLRAECSQEDFDKLEAFLWRKGDNSGNIQNTI